MILSTFDDAIVNKVRVKSAKFVFISTAIKVIFRSETLSSSKSTVLLSPTFKVIVWGELATVIVAESAVTLSTVRRCDPTIGVEEVTIKKLAPAPCLILTLVSFVLPAKGVFKVIGFTPSLTSIISSSVVGFSLTTLSVAIGVLSLLPPPPPPH